MSKIALVLLIAVSFMSQGRAEFSFSTITSDEVTSSEINETSFGLIASRVFALYLPKFSANNLEVSIGLDWEKPWMSAYVADLGGPRFSINFWGGIARVPGMNEEAWALIACHETGHLLGGEPYSRLDWNPWSSAEGQCDYFAASECLKNYRRAFQLESEVNPECVASFDDAQAQRDCSFTMKAAQGFAKMLEFLSQYRESYSIETPDQSTVTQIIFNSYPSPQCRVDTIVAGAFCELKEGKARCESEASQRPACWFAR